MIPTLWLLGALVGRWWAVPLGAVLWLLLVLFSIHLAAGDLGLVVLLAAANTAVGVALRQGVAWAMRFVGHIGRLAR